MFQAYKCISDSIIQAYMTTQQDAYVDGHMEFTDDQLMEIALNKYKILFESSKWNKPSALEPKTVTLSEEMYALK